MDQLEKFFEDLFVKKISLTIPAKAREVIVTIAPWVTLIILIVSLPALLGLFGFSSLIGGFGYLGAHFGARYYIGLLILLIQVIIMAVSISPLLKREMRGWKMVYYANLISFVYSLFSAFTLGDIIWSIISLAIGLYIMFQVKPLYK